MHFSLLTLGLAAVAFAHGGDEKHAAPAKFPPGISPPDHDKFGPFGPPDADRIDTFHPPHPNVVIDDCDDDKDDKWHWVHPVKPKPDHPKPEHPPFKWTTSTITATSTKTVIDCPDNIPCPGGKTKYTTVTVPVTTTICPVPVTEAPPAPPKPTVNPPPPPPKTEAPPPAPPKETISAPAPVPQKPSSVAPPAPPATTVGTVTKPAPPAATTSRVAITAGAVPNVQRAGGALFAAAVAAALL